MSDWYYAEGNDTRGPVSAEMLISLLNGRRDGQSVLVWRDGFEDWTEAGAVPELSKPIAGPPRLQRVVSAPNSTPTISPLASEDEQVPTEKQPRNWSHTIVGWIVAVFSLALSKFLGAVFWLPVLLIAVSCWLFTKVKLRDYIAVMIGILVGHTLWMIAGHAMLLGTNQADPDALSFFFDFAIVLALTIWAIRKQSVAVSVCILIYQAFVLGMGVVFFDEFAKVGPTAALMHLSLRGIGIAAAIYAIVRGRRSTEKEKAGPLTA